MSDSFKVFNIGFNRSGSQSLTRAMIILGFKSIHYLYKGKPIRDIFQENKSDNKKLLHGLDHYDFYSDFGGHLFLKDLDRQYPDSKFILTVRDMESWLDSRERHVLNNQKKRDKRTKWVVVDRPGWQRKREEFEAFLKEYFRDRPTDLLVIDIVGGEGWEKLYGFLKVPVQRQHFPYVDKMHEKNLFRKWWTKVKDKMQTNWGINLS